ncbi:MAG TPA: heterodisulfide reductase-related iron-sulfur binding cluster [Steroidobacteraceae bacterium]|nr:heterodisulfide reductase-related iron-sulfur binding cluster [Steroidobacteraceae bacterium]
MAKGPVTGNREGSLEAPTRLPIEWRTAEFYDAAALEKELTRVFDICHGCRRCFSLCNSFPTLFEAIDSSSTGELDSVDRKAYWEVVDHCYLCDMCYMTKCPYVPPHPWNVDFPHLMLRAKAVKHAQGRSSLRDRVLTSTDAVGRLAGIPVVAEAVNAVNRSTSGRKVLSKAFGVHENAPLPRFHGRSFRRRDRKRQQPALTPQATAGTTGRVALFVSCYGNRNEPDVAADLVKVFEHNGIPVTLVPREKCCGMPKLELGDLQTVARLKDENIPVLAQLVENGFDIVAPIPSCVLMFKQELPLMFPDDVAVARVSEGIFDPFEYLMLRHKAGLLRVDFRRPLGKIAYHVPCHLRVQNMGLKTRDVLQLVPQTTFEVIERCSGHNGTYAVKREYHEISMKIGRPVAQRVTASAADHYTSDCPMAGHQIEHGLAEKRAPEHPLTLLRTAYGI